MKRSCMPACYFPTTIVLIDDDAAYLHNLRIVLDGKRAVYRLFDNPKQALHFLNTEYHPDPFIQRIIERTEENERGHHGLDINVYPIRNEVYNAKRFEQISIIVIDQEMPGLKGLELCQALKDLGPVKKLMLTGEVDDKQAINAFNEGIINQFVNKKEVDFSQYVNEAIFALQKQYFDDLSAIVIDSLVKDPARNEMCCLTDPVFIEFFMQFCVQHKVVEYYLTDENGSFMLVDFKGKISFLAVQSLEDMQAIYLTADTSDNPPARDVVKQLAENKLMLYIHTEDESYTLPCDWQARGFLHPATLLKGAHQTYYYAYIPDIKNYEIDSHHILSFYQYLEEV